MKGAVISYSEMERVHGETVSIPYRVNMTERPRSLRRPTAAAAQQQRKDSQPEAQPITRINMRRNALLAHNDGDMMGATTQKC